MHDILGSRTTRESLRNFQETNFLQNGYCTLISFYVFGLFSPLESNLKKIKLKQVPADAKI